MNKECNVSILSFDQDWAPDFVCNKIADFLIEHQVKSTWFITNDSPFLEKIKKKPELFELGIHPNFLPKSSHGETPEDVITCLKKMVPDAKLSRSHAVYQYGKIIQMLRNDFEIYWDLTMFLYEFENIKPVKLYTNDKNFIYRLPVFWSEDHEFNNPLKDWNTSKYKNVSGVKVFSFHPIHVFLNSDSNEFYENYRKETDKSEIRSNELINKNVGCQNAFNELVNQLKHTPNYFISELKQLI